MADIGLSIYYVMGEDLFDLSTDHMISKLALFSVMAHYI